MLFEGSCGVEKDIPRSIELISDAADAGVEGADEALKLVQRQDG